MGMPSKCAKEDNSYGFDDAKDRTWKIQIFIKKNLLQEKKIRQDQIFFLSKKKLNETFSRETSFEGILRFSANIDFRRRQERKLLSSLKQ